jgi:alkylhydroperoxidase family enzyme
VYDQIVRGRRASGPQLFRITGDVGELLGPFGAMVTHPAVGGPMQELGAALRYEGCLAGATREVVICTVAAARDSAYEWYAHAAVARSVGVSEAALDAVRRGQTPEELADDARAARRLALALLAGQPITDELFTASRGSLSIEEIVEVVALVGYYRLLADLMKVFDADAAPREV